MTFVPVPGHPKYKIDENGIVHGKTGLRLKTFPNRQGYLRFTTYEAGRWQQVSVAVKVCEAFIGPRPEGYHAAHIDGNPLNNHVSNLAWKTPEENEADKILHGTSLQGERHHHAKLSEAQVLQIRAICGRTLIDVANQYGVSIPTIWNIQNRKTWRHLP